MNKSQLLDSLINFVALGLIALHLPAKAQETDAYIQANPGTYLKSNSGICHGPFSTVRASVALDKDANSAITNAYANKDLCLAAGGKINEEQKVLEALSLYEAGKKQQKEVASQQAEIEADNKFLNISWGLGLAFTYVGDPVVSDISIAEGDDFNTIYVNHQSKHRAIAMLESHYFRSCWIDLFWGSCTRNPDLAHGPFVGIGLVGEDGVDPLSTYALGWMLGLKRDDKGNSWNFGIGLFIDSKVKQLRPDFTDGGQTTLTDINRLTYQRDETGLALMFSSTF